LGYLVFEVVDKASNQRGEVGVKAAHLFHFPWLESAEEEAELLVTGKE